MSDFMLMAPSNQTFSELLSNGVKYIVPKFQRDYSWEQEQWEDLWADIENLDEELHHYMGYIVLQKKGEHEFDVIDGQQRLITLSIIVLSALKHLQDLINSEVDVENNNKRLSVFKEQFIGSTNPVTLIVENKLYLNRNNHRYFRELCSCMEVLNERSSSKTNNLLDQAFKFFVNKTNLGNGEAIAKLVTKFTSRLIFTKIITLDNINAYKVFETLNARGVQLSTPDLLKNHIFSTLVVDENVSDHTLDILDEHWSFIVEQLGENNFTDFIRYHHNMHYPLVQKRLLFKSIKQIVNKPKMATEYLDSLKKYSQIYSALLNPFDEWWARHDENYKEVKHYLEAFKLFGLKQPFQILMAAFNKFPAQEFILTLKYIYVLSMRYNIICHFSPNKQEQRYNQIAMKISAGEFNRASHIKNSREFKELYPDDNDFVSKFEYYKMSSRSSAKKIRFLLAEIENNLGRKTNYLNTTLEHVCPYNPDQNWQQEFGDGINDITDRLGNLILLDSDELNRKNFAEKKNFYSNSNFRLAEKVAEYKIWDLATLNDYQQWLAEQAAQTWRAD